MFNEVFNTIYYYYILNVLHKTLQNKVDRVFNYSHILNMSYNFK